MSWRREEGYIRQSFALLKGWMLRSAALSRKGIKKYYLPYINLSGNFSKVVFIINLPKFFL